MQDDTELKAIKAVVRSILISSATGDVGIPIQQLFRDYRGIEGQPLPFRNYNYNSLLDFLRSIKDTVNIVQNNAGEYFARPVGSGETQHILNMVCKQKSTKPRPRLNPSAWRNPGSSTYYRENQQRSNAYSNTNTRAYYPRRSASNASSIRGKKAYAAAPFIPQTPTYQPPYKNTFNPKYRWTAKEAAFTPFAAIPRMNESTFTRPMNRCEDSTQNTQAPSASLPQKMDNMSLEPRERTNTAPQDRVLPILRDAEDVFKTKGDDDVPKAVIPTPLPPPVPPKNEEQPIVAGYGVKIPENLLEDREGLIVGDQFNIVITEISSPTRFWFHSADYINVVETLMQQIESYYLTIPEEELRIYASEMKVGMVCAARVFHQWHRGEIVQIEKDSAKVFFQDYGTNTFLPFKDIKYLLMAFTRVPKQALRGCLANIRTVDGNRLWKPEPTLVMMKLVRDQELRAQCVRKYRENCYGLFINILDDLSEITLNNTLVHMGLAVNETVNKYVGKALKSSIGSTCLNYPSFKLLEGPNYLSFTERQELLMRGIDYNILEETNYFSYYPASLMENPNTRRMLNLPELKSVKHYLVHYRKVASLKI